MKIKILFLAALIFSSLLILQSGCKKDKDEEPKPPTASFTVSPSSGTTETQFQFDASGCSDEEDQPSALKVRWDWENDENWDTDWSSNKTVVHQYNIAGDYTVDLEVKDTEGLTDTETHNVTVSNVTFTDPRDGQVYNIVTIDTQTWFTKNLNYETSNSFWYDNSSTNGDIYGRLYTWYAALTACPSGWHLPSDDEWCTLTTYIDPTVNCNTTGWSGTDAGYKMKSINWWYSNGNGSDAYGFRALPGGCARLGGFFHALEEKAYFWSSTEDDNDAWYWSLRYHDGEVSRNHIGKNHTYSVRCVKD
jgi:uncharacterized protein (TIGR02145 family)